MFRWLVPFRRTLSREAVHDSDFVSRLRKYPILVACLSSGLLYHSYITFPIQNKCLSPDHDDRINQNLEHLLMRFSNAVPPNNTANELRMDRLLKLHRSIEDELPSFFQKSFFDFSSNLIDPGTIVYFQRKNGSVHTVRRRSNINALMAVIRAYFSVRSSGCRLELSSLLTDTEKWEVEVCFRIILLPIPTTAESHLPPKQLTDRLEQRARWHDYRATFYLSPTGHISSVKITQLIPPFKNTSALHPLKQLVFLRTFGSSLPGRRRLPSPTPFVFKHLITLDNFAVSHCDYDHSLGLWKNVDLTKSDLFSYSNQFLLCIQNDDHASPSLSTSNSVAVQLTTPLDHLLWDCRIKLPTSTSLSSVEVRSFKLDSFLFSNKYVDNSTSSSIPLSALSKSIPHLTNSFSDNHHVHNKNNKHNMKLDQKLNYKNFNSNLNLFPSSFYSTNLSSNDIFTKILTDLPHIITISRLHGNNSHELCSS